MLEAMYPDRKDFKVTTVGFTYKLTRKYSKFIFIYYIPRLNLSRKIFLFLFLQLPLCCLVLGILLDNSKGFVFHQRETKDMVLKT